MYKYSFLLCFLIFFTSCIDHNSETESRIIYEIDQKYSDFIVNHFEERFNEKVGFTDRFNFEKQYVQIGDVKSEIGDFRIAFYTNTAIRGNTQFTLKTNRFLKLSNRYIIPVVFKEDSRYTTKQNKVLGSVMGGGKIFHIDTYNKTITWVTEM